MIFRQPPKNKEKYIMVTDKELVYELQLNGFMPKYIDETALYFLKTKEIEKFIKELNNGKH